MTQTNEVLKKQIDSWSKAWDHRNLDAADDFFAANFVYEGTEKKWTLIELKGWYQGLVKKHPQVKVHVDQVVVNDGAIGISWTLTENKKVVSKGAGTGKFSNGKLVHFNGVTTD
jgi:hypothetical protein